MKCLLTAIVLVMIAATAANAGAAEKPSNGEPEYTPGQMKNLARNAHTVEQYTVLADYYATRQRMYKRKAAEEMHLWAMRSAMVTPLSEKWPRPVDSARNLHDYYEYKEAESARLQARYNRLADELAAK